MSGYGEYAGHYFDAGWAPLPLPRNQKFPPPDGTTGAEAPYPGKPDVAFWAAEHPDGNIAIRLPKNVVGIDVDAYDDKAGAQTLARLQQNLGALPPTWRSSARTDGVSGIYLFRLPDGVEAEFGDVGPGIETLRWNHRYAIVAPSLNPKSGTQYVWWWGPQMTKAPRVDQLPELPMAWVEHLREQAGATRAKHIEDVPHDAYDDLSESERQRIDAFVASSIDGIQSDLRESASWPDGHTDGRGRGWEKLQADKALRLAMLAKADWNALTLEQAFKLFTDAAPTGGKWGPGDVAGKWRSQLARADAAPFPVAPPPVTGLLGGLKGGVDPDDDAPVTEELASSWKRYSWDDIGNADRLAALHGSNLRHVLETDTWVIWRDGVWEDSSIGGEKLALDMLRQLPKLEAPLYSDEKRDKPTGKGQTSDREEFLQWCREQRYAGKIRAAATTLRYTGEVAAHVDDFDKNPLLLNVRNGVLDLLSGALLEHSPELMMRMKAPVAYDPDAKAPRWEAFLERVQPVAEMRGYLQRVVGYSITGDTREHAVFLHHGETNNGKSVFLEVFSAVLGGYHAMIPPQTLLSKKQEQHPTDIADMEGRYWLSLDETQLGARLDEGLMKRLTGGTKIKARKMNKDFHEFRMSGKPHIFTNHVPHINHDPATIRRLHMILWPVRIPDAEVDKMLAAKIIASELPGVLAWAVRGTQLWQQHGLAKPAEAELDVASFVEEEDEFGLWLSSRTAPSDYLTPTELLYKSYRNWAEAGNITPVNSMTFGRTMRQRGFVPGRGTGGARGWKLGIKDPTTALGHVGR